jgi:hypothetical protein
MRKSAVFLFAVSFLIPFMTVSGVVASPRNIHQYYLDKANAIPVKDGGLGGKLDPDQLSKLHKHIDLEHGIKGEYKRHTWSHNPKKVAEWGRTEGMNSDAAFNATCIHDAVDMADRGPAGVNGYTFNAKFEAQADKILARLEDGKSPLSGWWTKRWPDWLEKPGPLAKARYCVRFIPEEGIGVKVIRCGSKVIDVVSVGAMAFIIVYEGGNLVYSAIKKGVTSEEVVKRALRDIGIFGGAYAGGKAGEIICSPLLAMEPGGTVCYGICVAGFTVGGGIAGGLAADKVTTAIYQGREALHVVRDNKDMNLFLQAFGHTLDGQSGRGKDRNKDSMVFLVLLLFSTFFYAKRRKRRNFSA